MTIQEREGAFGERRERWRERRSERARARVFDAGAAKRHRREKQSERGCVSRRPNASRRMRAVWRKVFFDRAGETTARSRPDLCDAEVGDPGRPRRAGRRIDARSALGSRGTLPRGRADANPSRGGEASDATASRPRGLTERERGAKRIIEGIWAGGRADAPLSPYLSVASAAARRHPVRRGTARAYSRFSRARDVRCPPWPNLSSDSANPRPRLPKFRSPRQPDTAPRDVRDRHDRDRNPPRFSPHPCDDARASLGVFDVCAELSGARSRRFSQFFFNVTDRVCRKDAHLFSDARLYFVSLVSREFDREIRVSSNPKQTHVGRNDARTDESTLRREAVTHCLRENI